MTIPSLFHEQVSRRPAAVAVVSAAETLSYAALDARANSLAQRLIASGVGRENLVAVLMARSADLLVAFLAVTKTGAAYVPIDARSSPARQREILADTAAKVLLVDSEPEALQPATRVLRVDRAAPGALDTDPAVPVCPDQLAYVMYTSGSTGRPKGVAASHRNVVDLAVDPCWQVDEDSRVLFHAPHAFDASTYEIWVPLLAGGQVVVAPDGPLDATSLASLVAQHRITHVHVTAGLFRIVADQDPSCFAPVAEVLTGGDVVSPVAVRRVLDTVPGVTVRHLYGPTEITLCATQHRVLAADADANSLPIGQPLDGTRVYLLDEALRPVPDGEAGELYLAGRGLARGYLNSPALTAERFVADPYGPAGARMYRTGDIGRLDARGRLEFLGRADNQVKVRGFRVEPGEVEAALAGQPGVRQVAVVARPDAIGGHAIVAYVVPSADAAGEVEAAELPGRLRQHAAGVLADYLVPSAVVLVPALPLTANGKLDYRALPPPHADRTVLSPDGAQTTCEEVLCALFGEVLGVERFGVHDNFFDLGGHSLLAAVLLSRARAALGVEVPLSTLAQAPTVAMLAPHFNR